MKKNLKRLGLIIAVFLGMGGTIRGEASQFNYSVTPHLPESQLAGDHSYFDLLLKPNEVQELSVSLRNDTDKDIEVNVDVNSATTNTNGVVEYGNNNIKKDPSLKYELNKIVTVQKEIKVKAQSSEKLKLTVKMPAEKFEGIVAGGITFSEKKGETAIEDDGEKGLSIQNEYAYVVALLVRQTKKVIEPELLLNKAEAGQLNVRNVIVSQLQNPTSNYINQLTTDVSIMKKGSNEVLYSTIKEGMQMAPNSNFNLPLSLNGEKLKPGKYTVKITAYSELDKKGSYKIGTDQEGNPKYYKNKWDLATDLNISSEVARTLNEKDVTIKSPKFLNIYLISGLLILLLITLILLMIRKKNKKTVQNKLRGKSRQSLTRTHIEVKKSRKQKKRK